MCTRLQLVAITSQPRLSRGGTENLLQQRFHTDILQDPTNTDACIEYFHLAKTASTLFEIEDDL